MSFVKEVNHAGTHRLIPERYSGAANALETLNLPQAVLADLSELDSATNQRKLAESGKAAGIHPHELVFGVPEAHIVNAAFTHPAPYGGRFNGPSRGAWYAGLELETSVEEVAFHKRRFLKNVDDARFHRPQTFDYVDFSADFRGKFDHLENHEEEVCLKPGPIPECYQPSQALAKALLFGGALGIVYRSVRRPAGTLRGLLSARPRPKSKEKRALRHQG